MSKYIPHSISAFVNYVSRSGGQRALNPCFQFQRSSLWVSFWCLCTYTCISLVWENCGVMRFRCRASHYQDGQTLSIVARRDWVGTADYGACFKPHTFIPLSWLSVSFLQLRETLTCSWFWRIDGRGPALG